MAKKSLNVNGKRVSITYDDPQMPLLYVLRDNLGLHGPRFGCGLGQCGACTVHIDGAAVRSCITPLTTVNEKQNVVTLEGLGSPQKPHPVQKAFIDEQAAQCGYCINGMIMESAAFLDKEQEAKRSRHQERTCQQSLSLRNACPHLARGQTRFQLRRKGGAHEYPDYHGATPSRGSGALVVSFSLCRLCRRCAGARRGINRSH